MSDITQKYFFNAEVLDEFSNYNSESECKLIFYIQNKYSFRISEVLRLNSSSLVAPHFIFFKLSKSTESCVIVDRELFSMLKFVFSQNCNKNFSVNYKTYYRWYNLKCQNSIIHDKGKNRKVTHSARYRNVSTIAKFTNDPKIIKSLLHHASVKSQIYYIK